MANPEDERIQVEYLERLRHVLRRVPAGIREDALLEVQSHIEDEWQSLGGDPASLRVVLQRLGPPEGYGRDLALQLLLAHGRTRRSPALLAWAVLFWACTSLLGAVIVLCATFVYLLALGMLVVAVGRLFGYPAMLINAASLQVLGYHADYVRFPPLDWSPPLIILAGLLPALVTSAGVYRFFGAWVRSRLADRGLAVVSGQSVQSLPRGWERHALLTVTAVAALGVGGCLLFTILGELLPLGRAANVELPADFFRTPLTFLAFVSALVFFASPVLGLLWAARHR